MNLESLRSLQKHIREAKGADRELDFEILKALQDPDAISQDGGESYWTDTCEEHAVGGFETPRFTLDPDGLGSCVALMEELLPRKDGWRLSLHSHAYIDGFYQGDGICQATILHPISSGAEPRFRCEGVGYCRAILLAIISALIAQEEAKERVG